MNKTNDVAGVFLDFTCYIDEIPRQLGLHFRVVCSVQCICSFRVRTGQMSLFTANRACNAP